MGREVSAEPGYLRGRIADIDVAVQRHDVPRPEIVAVVAFRRITGGGAEVGEVSGRVALVVFVIPRRWTRTILMAPPCGSVAFVEVIERSVGIRVVTGREDGARYLVEQRGRGSITDQPAPSDVAGADERTATGAFGGIRSQPGSPPKEVAHRLA